MTYKTKKSDIKSIVISLKKIISIGLDQYTDTWLAGKIQLVNTISLANFIFILSMISIDLVMNRNHDLSIVLLIVSLVMLFPYYLNYKKAYVASRIAFLTLAYICICILAMIFGKHFYFQYYLVPGVGMSLIFFRNEIGKKKWLFTFAGIPLWMFLEVWFVHFPPLIVLDKQYVDIIAYFSSFLIFMTAILMFGTFTYESDKHLENISKMNVKLRELADTDPLTNLYNRRFIDKQINHFFTLAKRQNSFFALVVFDIDYFKKVNDTYGHDAGDKILQMLTRLLIDNFRETDIKGRIGGEEFCIAFREGDQASILNAIERFRKIIEDNTLIYGEHYIRITASFGISYISNSTESYEDLFKNADEALYEAKRAGRNKVVSTKHITDV